MAETRSSTDRALTPLLTLITQESLDEDYQHVARQRRRSGERERSATRAHWVAGAMVGVFGILISTAAVQTLQREGVRDASRETLLGQIAGRRTQVAELQARIVRLRELNIGLQDSLDEVTAQQAAAVARQTRLAASTGFGPVSGPGIVITVKDAPRGEPVQANDLRLLVNGLWEAGAEAISVNGKRLTARSALFNSGAAINLNGAPPLSPPYVVSAIGNNKTLQADLIDTTTGLSFTTLADALGFPVTMQNVDDLTLPAAPQRLLRLRSAVAGTAEQNRKPHAKETSP